MEEVVVTDEDRARALRNATSEEALAKDREKRDRAKERALALPQRDELKGLAIGVVADIACKVLNGEIKVDARNAKQIVEVFHNIARLEGGEPTSITKVDRNETINAIKALRTKAQRDAKKAVEAAASN